MIYLVSSGVMQELNTKTKVNLVKKFDFNDYSYIYC